MLKKLRVRSLIDSQHVKETKTLLKSAPECLHYIFWLLSKKIGSKNSFSQVSEILTLFVRILTPDNKYILSVKAGV